MKSRGRQVEQHRIRRRYASTLHLRETSASTPDLRHSSDSALELIQSFASTPELRQRSASTLELRQSSARTPELRQSSARALDLRQSSARFPGWLRRRSSSAKDRLKRSSASTPDPKAPAVLYLPLGEYREKRLLQQQGRIYRGCYTHHWPNSGRYVYVTS